jgi:hypothetical protein
MTVVTILKLDDRSPDFVQVAEDATVNGLFLQRLVEALSDAIRLRFGDEGVARRDAPESDLVAEVIRGVLRTVSMRSVRPRPTSAPVPPNSPSSACAIGCKAANRLPV